MSGVRVLVTGATGTTGSRVTAVARSAGAEVRTASRHNSDVLFDWHAALFPTGRSGMLRINLGAWRDNKKGSMQVVSGRSGASVFIMKLRRPSALVGK